jgi:hypothetical protein
MPEFDAAFDALEHLDDQGRLALRVSGQMYEELYLAADARAERAEFLVERFHTWASQWGLVFDLKAASEHWDAHHPQPETVLVSRYHTLLLERGDEVRELKRRLDDALDGREQAEIRAEQGERALAGVTSSCAGVGHE